MADPAGSVTEATGLPSGRVDGATAEGVTAADSTESTDIVGGGTAADSTVGVTAAESADVADLLGRVDRLVAEQLLPAAEATDVAAELPIQHFDAFAELGLNGMALGRDQGGLGLGGSEVRAVLRRLGSGCGATAFAFAQHHGTLATIAASANEDLRERWVPRLADEKLAGIAYAHVRRSGPPVLRARPAPGGGWIFDGQAPWVTSWGRAEVLGVAAVTDDGRLVWGLVPAEEQPGLRLAKRFDLAVFGATGTVALAFDDYRVDPDHLIQVVDLATWSVGDRLRAARPNPLCLGVGDRALALLAELDPDRAAVIEAGWLDVEERAEALSAAVDRGEAELETVAAGRAEAVLATQRVVVALLAAVGGRAMELGHPAQRLHREAGFYVVQAQNDDGRRAMLEAISGNR